MLAELKELIEWKDKAQENIKTLQKQLTAATSQNQTLTQDLDKEKKDRERLIEKVLSLYFSFTVCVSHN